MSSTPSPLASIRQPGSPLLQLVLLSDDNALPFVTVSNAFWIAGVLPESNRRGITPAPTLIRIGTINTPRPQRLRFTGCTGACTRAG